uniref:Uncharacterized protein n=1 Tax=Solanum lycopersicum TaxID=4081 RepID=A0A3Q7IIQ5_SOLLC
MSSNRLCLPCDIDLMFLALFSGDRSPYIPPQFLDLSPMIELKELSILLCRLNYYTRYFNYAKM